MRPLFPFAAVVGQADLKKSLMLCAVNPAVGGLLVRGEKGTAKSTLVRALAELLPEISVPRGCLFACDPARPDQWCESCRRLGAGLAWHQKLPPVITLPLNATEDRVSGSLDFEAAVRRGVTALSPGLLASAHRGILYVDEVNLLDDHLVDIILDASASGENRLEREGLSFRHPSRFMLIGTMNPEEGELRPQLLDRFGLSVAIKAESDAEARVELMLRREAFDRDPEAFIRAYAGPTADLREQLARAAKRLKGVGLPGAMRRLIAEICSAANAAGHRADLFLEQAALALAALNGDGQVAENHVQEAAPLVLAHRRRELQAPPPPPPDRDETEAGPDQPNRAPEPDENDQDQGGRSEAGSDQAAGLDRPDSPAGEAGEETVFQIGEIFRAKSIQAAKDRARRRGSGRRSRSRVSQKQGRYIKSGPDRGGGDIALDATLRAAAPYQQSRRRPPHLAIALSPADIREKEREKRLGNFLFFAVDASGSMGARGRMAASKGAVMSLLLDAYQKRDRVALISFRGSEARLNLPLTGSIDLAGKMLAEMPVGGRTPLSLGLALTWREMRNALTKNPLARPIVVLITDGRSNVSLDGAAKPFDEALRLAEIMSREERAKYIVVDTEEAGLLSFGRADRLAEALGADHFKIRDLKAETLVNIVKGNL